MWQELVMGGDSGAYGTCTDTTGNAQTVTINTGLTSIKRFMMYCLGNTGSSVIAFVTYNYDLSSTNYITYVGSNSYNKAIGTATGYAYGPMVNSISGGTITLKTGANAAATIKNAWWVACS